VLKCLDRIMLTGIRDQATEIRCEPGQASFEVRHVVKNEVYDLLPPPAWVHVPMTRTAKAIVGIYCDQPAKILEVETVS